jgi:putative restriction endonuclease
MSERVNWSREEHILAFNLYNQISFGTIHIRNPQIQKLAKVLGRTVGSVSYKLANFARLDPALMARGIRGATHGAKGEEAVWEEFASDPESLAFECQRLMAARLGEDLTTYAEVETRDLPKVGMEREAIVRLRVNQGFFRRRVVSAYDGQCCVTGLSNPELLVASHIIPWAEDVGNRLNPRNGLCLNRLHDAVFDRYLMWVDEDFVVHLSSRLVKKAKKPTEALDWIMSFDKKPLFLPKQFRPDPALLKRHAERFVR